MKKVVEQRDEITNSIVAIEERAVSPVAGDGQEEGSLEEEARGVVKRNPFLLPPTWEEENKNVKILTAIEDKEKEQEVKNKEELVVGLKLEEDAMIHGKPNVAVGGSNGPRDLFTWTWIGGLEETNMLAKSGGYVNEEKQRWVLEMILIA